MPRLKQGDLPMFAIYPSARLRPSPFFEATVAEGVASFTTYNNMLMPTGFGRPEEEYWRLINGVSMWDVAVERQVQLKGKDAARLAQILAPRDLTKCVVGQGKYVALCNHAGTLINDPIMLKLADNLFWLSIADSNILFWARAIAAERGLDRCLDVRRLGAGPEVFLVQGDRTRRHSAGCGAVRLVQTGRFRTLSDGQVQRRGIVEPRQGSGQGLGYRPGQSEHA
jgi:glycine cleavage system aminomethyltransferase T